MTQFVSSPHASKRRPLVVCNTTFGLLPLHASRCPFLILTKMFPNSACDKLARVGDANGEAHRTRLPGSAFCLLCCASVASDQPMPLCRHLSLVVPTWSQTQPYFPSRCLSGKKKKVGPTEGFGSLGPIAFRTARHGPLNFWHINPWTV